jgi:hypothetical protein
VVKLADTQGQHALGVFQFPPSAGPLETVLDARCAEDHWGMDSRLPGVEFEAHGKVAPTVGKNEGKAVEKAGKPTKSGLLILHCEI